MPNQWIQLTGALLILVAYVLLQAGRLQARNPLFSLLNFVGAGLLAFEAARTHQWGFLLLEGTWSLVSLWALGRSLRRRSRRRG